MEFYLVVVVGDPLKDFGRLVPPGIVGDQVYSPSFVSAYQLLEKPEIRLGIEDLDKAEMKFRLLLDHNCSDDFDTLSPRKALHLRADSSERPVTIDGAGLPEQSLVLVNQNSALPTGFFLILGSSFRIHHACIALSALESRRLGYCMEKANLWRILLT